MRIAALLAVAGLLVLVVGCGEEDPTGPGPTIPAPTNLALGVAGTDSLSIQLSWTAPVVTGPADLDGFIVYFKAAVIGSTLTTVTHFDHTPTSLGMYSVKAYKEDDKSEAIEKSTALQTATNQGPVYWLGSANESGYGWDTNGSGTIYSVIGANKAFIDLILDSVPDLVSPETAIDPTWHTTGIAYNVSWTYSGMTEAPQSGYINFQSIVLDGVYVLYLETGHHLKMQVTTYDTGTDPYIRFQYGFQTVAGFRRLG